MENTYLSVRIWNLILEAIATQVHDRKNHSRLHQSLTKRWIRFWMRHSGLSDFGRIATLLASWFAPPHKARVYLAHISPRGYFEPSATIYHSNLRVGANVFVGDHVIIFEGKDGGPVELGDRVHIFRHTIIETAHGGSLTLEAEVSIHHHNARVV